MRKTIKSFISNVAKEYILDGPIYEFGSLQVEGQVGFADLRPFFPGLEYIGADIREGIGVDKILNLHSIELLSESVGCVLCMDTLEHVEYPHIALEEIHRILKPDGITVISSVMKFPIHDYPSDYWRFTPEGFKSILKPFKGGIFVGFLGDPNFPHTVVGIGFKDVCPSFVKLEEKYQQWKRHWKG